MSVRREVVGDRPRPDADEPLVLYLSDRTRVIRMLLPNRSGTAIRKEALGPSSVVRTRHELEILHRLAGVAGVIQPAAHVPAGVHAITFDDIGARSLADVISVDRFEPAWLPRLALRLATILAGVHRAGVMHRDLNPTNIVLHGAGPEPMLIDFDLATTFAEVRHGFTHHRQILGRLPYLSPEQTGRTGLSVDLRADLYGLGATLYELAVGHPPFGDGDPLQLVRDILARVPTPLAEIVPGISPWLSEIIARLLEKEPGRRYQSAEGLAHDLQLLCERPGTPLRLGERDFPTRLSPPSALVGRDAELDTLRSVLDDSLRSRKRSVLVAGVPGVGKSALIEQLRPMVTARGGWYVAGKFDQYRHDVAASAVSQALTGLGRLLLAEPQAELVVQRERIMSALGPNVGLIAAAVPEFTALLGADHPVPSSNPMQADARLRQASLDLLRAVASPDRPIVIVLDDLQWAGNASIDLIDAVHTDDELRGLLLVGAYRDQEVDSAHPLTAVLSRWEHDGVAPPLLKLANLTASDLAVLLGEMLRLPAGQATALAGAVGERTAGNPYDTVELVNALRREGVVVMDEAGWRWDEAAIRHHVGHGDVVDLLKERIDRLPARSSELLEIMSCLGGTVRLDLLGAASGHPQTVVRDLLTAALEDALLVMDEGYETGAATTVWFHHDRVQQATRDRLDPATRDALHLAIARRLATAPDLRTVAAEQYLAAVDSLDEPTERKLAAELFEVAARGASRASNHATAERYLAAATALWNALGVAPDDPRLVGLETARHAALYNLGRLVDADAVYRSIERRCADPVDLADAASLQVCSLTNRNQPADAVALGFSVLVRFGLDVPEEDILTKVEQWLDFAYAWIDEASVDEDVHRPEATDPRALAAALLIRRMAPAALFSDQSTLLWLFLEAQQLWEEFGPCDALVPALCMAGFSILWLRPDYDVAVRIQRHVLAVGEARGYEIETSQARYLYACTAGHWFEPVEEDVRHARTARETLLRGGELQSACFSFNPPVEALLDCGPTLDDLDSEVDAALDLCARTGNHTTAANIIVYRQFARAMRGETDGPGSFADSSFDPEAHLRINSRAATYAHINRALSAALFGDTAELVRHAAEAMRLVAFLAGRYPTAVARVVGALALAHRIREAPAAQRPALFAELDDCVDWLARRADDAPENFRHLQLFAEAERAAAADDFHPAAAAFYAALRESAPRQRPWHRALIAERAGLFHLASGLTGSGRGLLLEARQHYEEWGATGKVRELDRAYPFLRRLTIPAGQAPLTTDQTSSSNVRSDDIDLIAILRASQALSSETELDRLHASIVDQMRAISGAATVQLVIFDDGAQDWVLPATGPDQAAPVPVTDTAARGLLPVTAFRYVERTRQPLLVNDAADDDRFAHDPYLAGADRCSLLVVPVLQQGVLRAVLILENRLSSGVFSAERLDAVLLIAGQLAVSLNNAMLYRHLEEKVAERTTELQAANAQLQALSLTDPLTGLANRRRFADVLDTTWRAGGTLRTPVGIAMIDIDHFKWYNDDHGHPAGDACLQKVAAALVGSIRPGSDLVCRYGGEEFAVIFTGADESRGVVVAERIRKAVAALAEPHRRTEAGIVSLSIGVAAVVPAAGQPAESLVKAADEALYEAKRSGRNRVWGAENGAYRVHA